MTELGEIRKAILSLHDVKVDMTVENKADRVDYLIDAMFGSGEWSTNEKNANDIRQRVLAALAKAGFL